MTPRDFFAEWDAQKQHPPTVAVAPTPSTAGTAYARTALTNEAHRVATAANGSRNHTLNAATFSLAQLVATGALTETEVREHLTDAANTAGLEPDEIEATIRSGMRGGQQHPRTVPEPRTFEIPALTALATESHTPAPEHTSWWFRDINAVLNGTEPELTPTVLTRDDGQAVFYPGRVNGLIGESESGKTWVALLAVAQALRNHTPVLYLDFEDSAAGIISRLRSLGVTDDDLKDFAYVDPDVSLGSIGSLQRSDLDDVLTRHKPELIVTDGFNAAMTLLGLNLESNTDATTFAQQLLKPLANTGATVVYIDHVPKNRDNQGKGGIGAQAKRAMTTGCALKVEISQEFGRGMTGQLKLTVDKDRLGHVRAISAQAKNAGVATLVSDATTGAVTMHIAAPDMRTADEKGPFRPTALMQKVSLFLASLNGDGVPGSKIEENVSGRAETVRAAVEMLVIEGYVSRKVGPRNSVIHKSVRPFLDNSLVFEFTSSNSSRPRPTSSGTGSVDPTVSSSARPTPYRGDGVDELNGPTDEPVDLVPDIRKLLAQDRTQEDPT